VKYGLLIAALLSAMLCGYHTGQLAVIIEPWRNTEKKKQECSNNALMFGVFLLLLSGCTLIEVSK